MEKQNAADAAINEKNRERNLRYIYAKVPRASPAQLAMIAGFVRGVGIDGFDDSEYHRPIPDVKETNA